MWLRKSLVDYLTLYVLRNALDYIFVRMGIRSNILLKWNPTNFWGFLCITQRRFLFYLNTIDSPWNAKCDTNACQGVIPHFQLCRRYLQVVCSMLRIRSNVSFFVQHMYKGNAREVYHVQNREQFTGNAFCTSQAFV